MSTSKGTKKTRKPEAKLLPRGHINLEIYIQKALKQIYPEMGITKIAKDELNSSLNYIGQALVESAMRLLNSENKGTFSVREMQGAVRVILTGTLAKHALSEGNKAITKFRNNKGKTPGKPVPQGHRAGILFSVSRCRQFFEKYKKRITEDASVFLAAVLEYLTFEILEISANAAQRSKKLRITARFIMLAVNEDQDICDLINKLKINFSGAGVVPHINKKLLESTKKKDKAIKEIKSAQKESSCLLIRRSPFDRLVREIAQGYGTDIRMTSGAANIIQMETEDYIVKLLEKANLNAIHADRVTLFPKDIALAKRNEKRGVC